MVCKPRPPGLRADTSSFYFAAPPIGRLEFDWRPRQALYAKTLSVPKDALPATGVRRDSSAAQMIRIGPFGVTPALQGRQHPLRTQIPTSGKR